MKQITKKVSMTIIRIRIILGALCLLLFIPAAIIGILMQPKEMLEVLFIGMFILLAMTGLWAVTTGASDLSKIKKEEQTLRDKIAEESGKFIYEGKCPYCINEISAEPITIIKKPEYPDGVVYCTMCKKPVSIKDLKKVPVENTETSK